MKKIYAITLCLFLSGIIYGQIPPLSFNYHGIARDASNNLVTDSQIGIQLNIMNDFYTILYTEEFTPQTDHNGSFIVQIGTGITSGNFGDIDWSLGPNFLNVQFTPVVGNPYTNLDTIPFLSVPYALMTDRISLPYEDSTDAYLKTGDGAFSIISASNTDSTAAIKGVAKGTAEGAAGLLGIGTNLGQYGVVAHGNAAGIFATGRHGIWAEAKSANGVGVVGHSHGDHGISVYAGAFYAANGTGLKTFSFSTGTSAYFDGGKVVIHGDHPNPSLIIERNSGSDAANIRFRVSSAQPDYWQIDAKNSPTNNFFSISSTGAELFRINKNGSVKFTGALMPNDNAGATGQFLTSAGPGAAPVWTNPGALSFNNTYLYDQWLNFTPPFGVTGADIPTLSQNVIFIYGTSKILIDLSLSNIFNAGNSGGGNSKIRIELELRYAPTHPTSPGMLINRAEEFVIVANGESGSVDIAHHCYLNATGPLEIRVKATILSGDTDITIKGVGPNNTSNGQMTVQIIPQ